MSKSGDPTGTARGEYPWACSSVCSVNVGKRKESIFQQAMRLQRDQYRRIAKTEPTVDSEKMKFYDDYKDGRIDRDSYKQRAGKISVQLDEIKRKIEDAENSKKLLEQNELLIK